MAEENERKFKAVILELERIVADTASYEEKAWESCAEQLGVYDDDLKTNVHELDSDALAEW
ncbi:MAG TPA: hypothetical protein VFK27_00905, partial [Bacillales bacterium]|nr:hypothetical protein [Bacillales bacterium]